MTFETPRLLVLSGYMGSGKTTTFKQLVERHGFKPLEIITPTRKARPGDFPGQYTEVSHDEYVECAAEGSLLLDVITGYNDRFGLTNESAQRAIEDKSHPYVATLTPVVAHMLLSHYVIEEHPMDDAMPTLFMPNPGKAILLARAIRRGDDPAEAADRLSREFSERWDEIIAAIPNSHTLDPLASIKDVVDRSLELMSQPVNNS